MEIGHREFFLESRCQELANIELWNLEVNSISLKEYR